MAIIRTSVASTTANADMEDPSIIHHCIILSSIPISSSSCASDHHSSFPAGSYQQGVPSSDPEGPRIPPCASDSAAPACQGHFPGHEWREQFCSFSFVLQRLRPETGTIPETLEKHTPSPFCLPGSSPNHPLFQGPGSPLDPSFPSHETTAAWGMDSSSRLHDL